ncbi:MAG TPA: metallophosphoesterase [Clostridia bacterium]|nr:metallophosphoesterase [Clostridia bacterium]
MLDIIIGILFTAAILTAADAVFETNFPVVREVRLDTDKLKKGKEIVLLQISDLHGMATGRIAETILKEAGKIRPDAILITGDMVDRGTRDLSGMYQFVGKLCSLCPEVFFVSGNHEWGNEGKALLLSKLQEMGVKPVNNKGAAVSLAGVDINLCGVDDPHRRKDNIEKAMKGVDAGRYTILLAHSPRIRKRLGSYTPDLILCGHTHGGQVRLPLVGAVIEPGEGLFPKYDKGGFVLENGSLLYIDSGAGTSKLPVRFLNRSQISRINITGSGGQGRL